MTMNPDIVETAGVPKGPSYLDWGAVFGGAVVAAAAALVFLFFGSAVGLGLISPFAGDGGSATTIGIVAAVWFLASSAAAYYFGGYVAGRMRGVWGDATASEIETRDALHGVVVWATGALLFFWIGATTLSSVATGVANVGAQTATALGSLVQSEEAGDVAGYTLDRLYRSDLAAEDADPQDLREQSSRLLARALEDGELSAEDKDYLVSLVASQTSLSEIEAEQRVDAIVAEARTAADEAAAAAKEAADAAQNASVALGFLIAAGFLVSLISAWFGAVLGGSHRNSNTVSPVFVIRRKAA